MTLASWIAGFRLPPWGGYSAALVAVAAMSGLIGLVERRADIAHISMLYLVAVLATATAFGSGPAVLAAVAAFFTFNWFFVEPRYTFTVADPEEVVALLLFLATAVVTGQLAAGQRRRAREAEQREREASILYDVARLLAEPQLDSALDAVAQRLRQELRLAAVTIEVADRELVTAKAAVGEPGALAIAAASGQATRHVLGGGPAPTAQRRGAPGRWVRVVPPRAPGLESGLRGHRLHMVPVKSGDRRVGSVVLVARRALPSLPRVTTACSRQSPRSWEPPSSGSACAGRRWRRRSSVAPTS